SLRQRPVEHARPGREVPRGRQARRIYETPIWCWLVGQYRDHRADRYRAVVMREALISRTPTLGWLEAELTGQPRRVDDQCEQIGPPGVERVGWQPHLGWRREVHEALAQQRRGRQAACGQGHPPRRRGAQVQES